MTLAKSARKSRADVSAIPVALVFEQVGPADFEAKAFEPGLFQNDQIMNMFAKVIVAGYESMSAEQQREALDEYINTSNLYCGTYLTSSK